MEVRVLKKILILSHNKVFGKNLVSFINSFNNFDAQYLSSFENSFRFNPLVELTDIIFIRMGEKDVDGFHIGREIRKSKPDIKVIFISDSDRYATEAFEEDAADYLVCPLTKERLEITLDRVGKS